MKFFRHYLLYIKNNPHHYWFKRKLYGWGWTPATREGWAITFLYLALIGILIYSLPDHAPFSTTVVAFILPLVALTVGFIGIAYIKGESPRWQWGDDEQK